MAQFQLLRHLNQMALADQVSPQLRKLAFPKMREALKQLFAGHQLQHRITQKFQLLVVTDLVLALARLLRFLFPGLRAMRDRLLNDGPPPETVAQSLFPPRNFPFLHAKGLADKNLWAVCKLILWRRRSLGWSRSRAHVQFGQPIFFVARSFARP